jgi:hypothetical protein
MWMMMEEMKLPKELFDKIIQGFASVNNLIDESDGVDGLHLNGDVAPWKDLQQGGKFEEWLIDFNNADQHLNRFLESEKTKENILKAIDEPLFSPEEYESGYVDEVLANAPMVANVPMIEEFSYKKSLAAEFLKELVDSYSPVLVKLVDRLQALTLDKSWYDKVILKDKAEFEVGACNPSSLEPPKFPQPFYIRTEDPNKMAATRLVKVVRVEDSQLDPQRKLWKAVDRDGVHYYFSEWQYSA